MCVVVGAVGAELQPLHDVLRHAAQRAQAQLALPHVEGRAGDQLFQEQIHTAGQSVLGHRCSVGRRRR